MTENAIRLLKSRYCHVGETPEDVFKRISYFLSIGDKDFEKWLFNSMIEGIFLPNSPCIRNAGKKKSLLHACFILDSQDSIESIFNCIKNTSIIFHHGGGVGVNFSKLRPKDTPLSTGGTSSGAISFMSIFDTVTNTVKQGGFRRGALMGVLKCDHPEITMFVRAKLKEELLNFNLSVLVDDRFMDAIKTSKKIELVHNNNAYGKIKAKDIFDLMCFAAWCSGDPGILFFDRINKDNKKYPEIIIECTNPCSEVPGPPNFACCLGSINLSKFVKDGEFLFDKFGETVRLGSRALLNINRLSWYPLQEIYLTMSDLNPIGLGVMGFADCLIKLGIKYNSEAALNFIDELSIQYKEGSEEIARDSFYKRIIAPTGSLSIMANCSSGIEPIFSRHFERHLDVDIGIVEEKRDLYESEYTVTAYEVEPEWHLKVLAKWQSVVDGGVSKTINLPNSASVDDIKEIYLKAYEMGIKGISVFRDGCKEGVLKSIKEKDLPKMKCEDDNCHL